MWTGTHHVALTSVQPARQRTARGGGRNDAERPIGFEHERADARKIRMSGAPSGGQDLLAGHALPPQRARLQFSAIHEQRGRALHEILEGWNAATPDRFKLTLKAPKRITHEARLRDCADRVRQFLETAAVLGPKLGALLFQLPPNLKKDLALFDAFLDAFMPRVCAAFEFRHPSWLDEDIYARLRARNLALCIADSEKLTTPVEITADYAYFRLRDEGYTPEDIARWAGVIRAQTSACGEVFVYFKHEESGKGPEFGRMLMERLSVQEN